MRIAIAGFSLESVSFLPDPVTVADFRRAEAEGEAIIARFRGTNTVMGGFIKVLEDTGAEIVPILTTEGGAAGPAADEAFVHYVDRICAGIAAAGTLDGVLIHPHGAMTTPTRLDPDREFVERVRGVIGRGTKLVVALDYHGNIDDTWVRLVDGLFGYHYSPHTDMGATGERAADCLVRTLRGEIRPVVAIAKPGVMVPSIFSATDIAPLSDIVRESVEMPGRVPGLLDVSVFAGFSYADVPNCGFAAVAVADGNEALAHATASLFSARIAGQRAALMHRDAVLSVTEGVDRAVALARTATKPVVLLEHADRMNDSTYVLREVVRRGLTKVAVPFLCDPGAAAAATAAGVGATVTLDVGSDSSPRAGGKVRITGRVLYAQDTEFVRTGPVGRGGRTQLGPVAVIDAGGIVVSVTTNQTTAIDRAPFEQFGLVPEDFDIIVLRSKTHFRAVYEPLAEAILIVDTPDWGPADLTTLPYRHVPTETVYPFRGEG
jgi:microcystin degradation protein MlrC